jgi:hypothetical protein
MFARDPMIIAAIADEKTIKAKEKKGSSTTSLKISNVTLYYESRYRRTLTLPSINFLSPPLGTTPCSPNYPQLSSKTTKIEQKRLAKKPNTCQEDRSLASKTNDRRH